MELKPIHTKRGYEAALKQAETCWDAPTGSPKAEQLDVLVLLIEDYEARHFPIDSRRKAEVQHLDDGL